MCNGKNLVILDFYLPSYGLAIELDGKSHYTKEGVRKDRIRTARLKKEGIQVIRFSNQKSQEVTVKYLKDLLRHLNKR